MRFGGGAGGGMGGGGDAGGECQREQRGRQARALPAMGRARRSVLGELVVGELHELLVAESCVDGGVIGRVHGGFLSNEIGGAAAVSICHVATSRTGRASVLVRMSIWSRSWRVRVPGSLVV